MGETPGRGGSATRRSRGGWIAAAIGLLLTGCAAAAPVPTAVVAEEPASAPVPVYDRAPDRAARAITLAFAGDVHFELQVADLLQDRGSRLGPAGRALATADLAMVNLETAITERGVPDPKELEDAWNRYWFRAPASALDFLARSGVDVVSVANNHGADYGPVGLQDTLRAKRRGPLAVVGVGRNRREAFTPYDVTVKGVDLAVLAADASPREGMSSGWSAGPDSPGLAAAHEPRPDPPAACGLGRRRRRRRGRGLPALGRGAAFVPDAGAALTGPPPWSPRAPTSSWGATHTSCSAPAGWAAAT